MAPITLKRRVAELIAKHGTLRAAARAIQVEPSYLSRIERGEKDNPSALTLRRMGLREVVAYERLDRAAPPPLAQGDSNATA